MKIEVHRLTVGDTDDPEVMASFVLGDWMATDKGQWCKQHLQNLSYVCRPNVDTLGFDIMVYGEIKSGPSVTEFMLRWQ